MCIWVKAWIDLLPCDITVFHPYFTHQSSQHPSQVSYQSPVHLWGRRAEWYTTRVFTTALPTGYCGKTSSAFFLPALLLWVQCGFCRTAKAELAHLPYKVFYCSASAEKGKIALFILWYLIYFWHCRIIPKSCASNVKLYVGEVSICCTTTVQVEKAYSAYEEDLLYKDHVLSSLSSDLLHAACGPHQWHSSTLDHLIGAV